MGLGKSLIVLGLFIAAIGTVLTLAGNLPWLRRLPGDILFRRGNVTLYFPITTCIILSALLSLLFWLLRK